MDKYSVVHSHNRNPYNNENEGIAATYATWKNLRNSGK